MMTQNINLPLKIFINFIPLEKNPYMELPFSQHVKTALALGYSVIMYNLPTTPGGIMYLQTIRLYQLYALFIAETL